MLVNICNDIRMLVKHLFYNDNIYNEMTNISEILDLKIKIYIAMKYQNGRNTFFNLFCVIKTFPINIHTILKERNHPNIR